MYTLERNFITSVTIGEDSKCSIYRDSRYFRINTDGSTLKKNIVLELHCKEKELNIDH